MAGNRLFLRKDFGNGRRAGPTVSRLDRGDVARLVDAARTSRPDFILFEGVGLLEAMREVRRVLPEIPIVVDFHNVEARLYEDVRLAGLPRAVRPFVRLLWRRRLREAAEADREALLIAGSVWTCSDRDADLVRGAVARRPVHVVPNPIPAWCGTADLAMGRDASRSVLFVGHLGYAPNRRAIDELVTAIMPALRERFADARLHVCGRAPRDRLKRLLEGHGHRLTADPPDLSPLYRDAAVAVMPLRQGGGTRIKALEALAVGCPVVATAKAVEGLPLEDGRHFLRAETTSDFVSALARLFEDPDLAGRLSREGRAIVQRTHGDAARADAVRRALAGIGCA